jgi:fructoselysine-6-P-deglycase FrlB-like protein
MRFPDGIDAQPGALARSATSVRASLPSVAPLPEGALIALVGIGASEHIARSAAPAWRAAGLRAIALPASELMDDTSAIADVYVALSESGRSAETVEALSNLRGRRIGITNMPDSPLAGVVEELLPLDSGPDSAVYTTGYTATLQAVDMLGGHWAGKDSDWSVLPELASSVLTASTSIIDSVAVRFDSARVIDVVGSGVSAATVGEGALVLREAARAHTAAHETHNYLHGPMEPLDPQTACVIVGGGREVRLARDVSSIGCHTILITTRTDVDPTETLTIVNLPEAPSPLARAVLEILPLQRLAWRLANGRGLAVDGFRYQQDDTKLGSR